MKVFVTGVAGQLGHDVMNELSKRGYEGIGSDIAPEYSGVQDGSAVTTMPYVSLDITDNIILNYILVQLYGVYGIVTATIIPLVLINFIFGGQILFKYYFTEFSILGYFKDNIIYAVVTAMVTLCTWNITKYIPGSGFLHLIIKALACVIIPNILFILFYARTNNFKMARKWIGRKIRI